MSDFSKYSLQRLTKTIDTYTGKLLELELEDSPNQVQIQTIEQKLDQMDLDLKEKTPERDEIYFAEAFVPANLPTQNFRQ